MQIQTVDIRNGLHLGETVYVCDYNQPDLNKKALRNVPPTKCIVRSVDDTKSRVYYSKNYFAPVGKSGNILSRVISPVDATGFRTHPGNELYVFTTEEECVDQWNTLITEHCRRIQFEIDTTQTYWINRKTELVDKLK